MIRRIFMGVISLSMSVGVMAALPATAAAYSYCNSYSTCDGKSPVTTGCYVASSGNTVSTLDSVEISDGGLLVGALELRYSSKCHAAWARVVLNTTYTHDYYGYGIYRTSPVGGYDPSNSAYPCKPTNSFCIDDLTYPSPASGYGDLMYMPAGAQGSVWGYSGCPSASSCYGASGTADIYWNF